jgi:hypothetical protein
MEPRVTRSLGLLLAILCLALPACEEDPARSVKIATRAPVAAESRGATPFGGAPLAGLPPGTPPGTPWHLDVCSGEPEPPQGPSTLRATGPCAFEHRAATNCESAGDDFIVAITRKTAGNATLVVFLNVERYRGPGSYENAEMFVAVQDGTSLYRWWGDTVNATVGPDEAFVTLTSARLEAEPLHMDCVRVIGPETNYLYDCEKLSNERTAVDNTFEDISGTLVCETKKDG